MTTWTQIRPAQRPLNHAAPKNRYDPLFEIGLIAGAVLLYFSVRGVTEGSETAAPIACSATQCSSREPLAS